MKQFTTKPRHEFIKWIKTEPDNAVNIVSTGLYAIHLEPWLEIFNRQQFFFINGEDLLKKPAGIFKKLEQHLDLDKFFTGNVGGKFVRGAKGFYCFNKKGQRSCKTKKETLTDKGFSRDPKTGEVDMDDNSKNILNNFYKQFNQMLFNQYNLSYTVSSRMSVLQLFWKWV